MKLRNKKFAAGLLAVIIAAAMPVTAFAGEVSDSDVADKAPAATVESIKESIKGSMDKIPSADELLGDIANPDLDALKGDLDKFNGSIKDLAGIPSTEEIKKAIEAYFGDSVESVDTQKIKEYLEAYNKLNPDAKVEIDKILNELKGNVSTTTSSTNSTTSTTVAETEATSETEATTTTAAEKYIIHADVEGGHPYLVYPGYDVELPKVATVTYNDGSKAEVPVTWTEGDGSPVNAKDEDTIFTGEENEYGYFLVYGTVANYNVKLVRGVRITRDAEKPTEPTTPSTEATTPSTEATTPSTQPSETTTTTDTVIENVQTGEGNYSMVWVMFMFSAAALSVTVTSRKFRCA